MRTSGVSATTEAWPLAPGIRSWPQTWAPEHDPCHWGHPPHLVKPAPQALNALQAPGPCPLSAYLQCRLDSSSASASACPCTSGSAGASAPAALRPGTLPLWPKLGRAPCPRRSLHEEQRRSSGGGAVTCDLPGENAANSVG